MTKHAQLRLVLVLIAGVLAFPAIPAAQPEIHSGETVLDSITVPGAMRTYQFAGQAGMGVAILAGKVTGYLDPELRLYAPSGNLEATAWDYVQAVIDDAALAETGWYVIAVRDYGGTDTGTFKVSLVTTPGGTSMGDIASGQTLSGSIAYDMQTAKFYGEAGNGVAITLTRASGTLDPGLRLYAPSGNLEASAWGYNQATIDDTTLAETGWYVVAVRDEFGGSTGTFKVSLVTTPGGTSMGDIASGQTLSGSIAHDMQTAKFYGEAGMGVAILAGKVTGYLDPELRLYAPSGNLEATAWDYVQAVIDDAALAETGWYVIAVRDYGGTDTGTFKVSLVTTPGGTSMGDIASGQSLADSVFYCMQTTTFYANAGNGVAITLTRASGTLDPGLRLYAPSGNLEASAWGYNQATIDEITIAETGWYVIAVRDEFGGSTGTFDLSFTRLPPSPNPISNPVPAFRDTVSATGVTLSWSVSQAPQSYDVYCGSTFPIPLVAQNLTQASCPLPPLDPTSRYTWYVVLKYAGGNEITGCQWWFATEAPTELAVTAEIQGSELVLSWEAWGGATAINVFRGTTPFFVPDVVGFSNRVAELPGSSTEYSSSYGVGNPSVNAFYCVMPWSNTTGELIRSNTVGETDYQWDIP